MRILKLLACATVCGLVLAFVGAAGASADTTLGLTTPPTGSSPGACVPGPPEPTLVQVTQDPSTPYFVPTYGLITQWQTNVTGDTVGAPLTFAVLRPSGGNYTVIGADSETVPSSSGVATFPLAHAIAAQSGDTLAIYANSTGVNCYFFGGSTPTSDDITALSDPSPPPSAGQTLTPTFPCGGGCTLNVAATLGPPSQDAGVTTSAGPSGASAGQAALLSSTVTNNGPSEAPITFTDNVPTGMTIDSAVAAGGACSASGQTVTCTITGLSSGQTAPVAVVVTPSSPGSYTNRVSVGLPSGVPDPSAANNSASATLSVSLSLPAKCVVPKLKGIKLKFARTALTKLGCKVRVKHKHSRVHRGLVIGTSPGRGTYAYQTTVTVKVSSGKKKKH